MALAGEADGYEEFRERYHAAFRQRIACDSRETVPAAFALATLAGGDLRRGVELAANFGRDTDTIASMTGALCGAVGGPDAIPETWITALGPAAVADAEALAARLAELARAKVAERDRLTRTVPGLVRSSAGARSEDGVVVDEVPHPIGCTVQVEPEVARRRTRRPTPSSPARSRRCGG